MNDAAAGICAVLAGAAGLAVLAVALLGRKASECICEDADNCTCGGAWGRCTHQRRGRARFMEGRGWIASCSDCREIVIVKALDRG